SVHRQAGAAHVLRGKQYALPMLTSVDGAENASIGLRSSRAAQSAGENDVRVRRMDDDAADAAALRQAHVGPGLAGIGRLINSIAHHVAIPDHPRLARPGPDCAWIRRS